MSLPYTRMSALSDLHILLCMCLLAYVQDLHKHMKIVSPETRKRNLM